MKTFFKTIFLGTLLVLVALFLIGHFASNSKTTEQKAAEASAMQKEKENIAEQARLDAEKELASLERVTSSEITRAYEENTVAADKRFKGKKFIVSGVVSDISTDFTGSPYLTLKGGTNQFMSPQFSFNDASDSRLEKLKKGVKVSLTCTGKGDVAKMPMAGECVLH